MFAHLLMLLTALTLSGVAAWFSVVGLVAIFAAAPLSVMIMGGTLEVAKLVTASWVYNNWHRLPLLLKGYLTAAVMILMVITSMGIFGYLSKAHLEQGVPTGDVAAQLELIDQKIALRRENIEAEKKNIESSRAAVVQLDAQVTARMGILSSTDAERGIQVRRQQRQEREQLAKDIETSQSKIESYNQEIANLNEERLPVASQLRKVEAEVGPIKYIAALIYGDNPDANLLERAVRWVTILLVTVFDPLAVIMLIAANFGFNLYRKDKQQKQLKESAENEEKIDRSPVSETENQEEKIEDTLQDVPPEPSLTDGKQVTEEPYEESIETALLWDPTSKSWQHSISDDTWWEKLREKQEINKSKHSAAEWQLIENNLRSTTISQERIRDLIDRLEKEEIQVENLTSLECEQILSYLEKNKFND